jgi:hypothetical protein
VKIYQIGAHDIDSYAFREEPVVTSNQRHHQSILPAMSGKSPSCYKRCSSCNLLLDKWNETLEGLKVKKRRYDIGATYDGITVVSAKFKEVYETNGLTGLRFRQLPDDPAFYDIYPTRAVSYDTVNSKARFMKLCNTCEQYQVATCGIATLSLAGTSIGPKEFVRSDVEFASYDEKHPLTFCGSEAARIFKAAKLRMLDLMSNVSLTE